MTAHQRDPERNVCRRGPSGSSRHDDPHGKALLHWYGREPPDAIEGSSERRGNGLSLLARTPHIYTTCERNDVHVHP